MAVAPTTAAAIPGYRIEGTIGRGGMAIVYLAVQQSLDRRVALKVLDRALAREPEFVARFIGEARLLASMHHRNIVAIHDVGEYDGAPYLAMEYFPEGSMLPLCGRLGEREVLRCIRDVASALHHAHARGVVHRDVKPDNIFRAADGVSMLGDFGIARGHHRDGATTAVGRALGTPQFMAPERWRDEPGDPRSDLYSLGVTLHALATGKVPYDGENPLSIGMRHANDPLPLLPAAFTRMQGLLASLMAKSADARAPSAAAVVEHVDALLAEIDADPDADHAGGRTSTARLLLEWPFRSRDAQPQTSAAAQTRTPRRLVAVLGAAVAAVLAALAVWQFGSPAVAPSDPRRVAVPSTVSLAIMPFAADAADEELVRLANVLTNDLTSGLARHRGLEVAERSAADGAHAQQLDDAALAERLRVGYALRGTLARNADALRVQAQLRELPSGRTRWETSFDGQYARFWELESHVIGAVTAVLTPSVEPAAAANPAGGSTDAFVHYLRGRQLLDGSGGGGGSAAAAAVEFKAALAKSPDSAAAHAGLCAAQLKLFESGRDSQQFDRARDACDAAMAADSTMGEVMLASGDLYRLSGDAARAIEFYRRAETDPALRVRALTGLGKAHASLGDNPAAENYLRRALGLQPGSWQGYLALGNFLRGSGRGGEAIDSYRVALSLAPGDETSVYNNMGSTMMLLDRLEEAADVFGKSLERKRTKSNLSNLGTVQFSLGQFQSAATLYREALTIDPDDYRLHGNLADSLSLQGAAQHEAAEHYLAAAERARAYLAARTDAVDAAADLAWYLLNIDLKRDALSLIEPIALRDDIDSELAYRLAQCFAVLGNLEAARIWRQKALERGFSPRIIASTPWFSAL